MMTNKQKNIIIDNIINKIELPESAYDKARNRYEDLGEWFNREESIVAFSNPHIFSQGSFRLGTAIRPLDESDEYDLDLACKLQDGVTKYQYTQDHLKMIIGEELEAYRKARGIKTKLIPKHRCWRLEYQDDLSFHMDIVPCIPADEKRRKIVLDSIRNTGLDENIAESTSITTVAITDDRHEGFKEICDNWNISNPEGYAEWFEYRMNNLLTFGVFDRAQVDDVPLFKRKNPLQQAAQLLKRHRDIWGEKKPDSKPISIIITTLAARAYNGEADIVETLVNLLDNMVGFINPSRPHVPNPVDPNEDFADRWYRHDCRHLRLKENFYAWHLQAKKDFQHLFSATDPDFICEFIEDKFSIRINKPEILRQLGVIAAPIGITTPKIHTINRNDSARPWKSI